MLFLGVGGLRGSCISLVLLVLAASSRAVPLSPEASNLLGSNAIGWRPWNGWSRSLHKRSLELSARDSPENVSEDDELGNCTTINNYPTNLYNSSCEVVREECGNAYELFNYLEFVVCDIGKVSHLKIAIIDSLDFYHPFYFYRLLVTYSYCYG